MFANTFQSGFISIFYSVGSSPLSIWNKEVKNGHIRRVIDEEVKSLVLEISGTNVATTFITCPQKPRVSLAIRLPFLVMIIKNMKKYFTFEIQILDDKDIRRRFRVSNFQSTTKVRPFCTTMPIGLSEGWNQVQFNLADFTRRAYGSTYLETVRVQVHANVRIRRIYFSDTLYSEDEMPNEFRLFLPTATAKTKPKEKPGKVVERKVSLKTAQAGEEVPSGAPPSPVESPPPPPDETSKAIVYDEPVAARADDAASKKSSEPSIHTEEAAPEPSAAETAPESERPSETAAAPDEGSTAGSLDAAEHPETDVETVISPAPDETEPAVVGESEIVESKEEEAPVEAAPPAEGDAPIEEKGDEVAKVEGDTESIANAGGEAEATPAEEAPAEEAAVNEAPPEEAVAAQE